MIDAWDIERAWKGGAGSFGCRALQAFAWPFHVAFRCRGIRHKIFLDGLGIEVWGAAEEASVDGLD